MREADRVCLLQDKATLMLSYAITTSTNPRRAAVLAWRSLKLDLAGCDSLPAQQSRRLMRQLILSTLKSLRTTEGK
jgi:hypothetical protein